MAGGVLLLLLVVASAGPAGVRSQGPALGDAEPCPAPAGCHEPPGCAPDLTLRHFPACARCDAQQKCDPHLFLWWLLVGVRAVYVICGAESRAHALLRTFLADTALAFANRTHAGAGTALARTRGRVVTSQRQGTTTRPSYASPALQMRFKTNGDDSKSAGRVTCLAAGC